MGFNANVRQFFFFQLYLAVAKKEMTKDLSKYFWKGN